MGLLWGKLLNGKLIDSDGKDTWLKDGSLKLDEEIE